MKKCVLSKIFDRTRGKGKNFKIATLLSTLLFFSVNAFAQSQLSGNVTDENGESLPGATVMEIGTTNGVATDSNGKFSIQLTKSDASLRISCQGFHAKEISLKGQTQLKVTLEERAYELDEVIVRASRVNAKLRDLPNKVEVIKVKPAIIGTSNDVGKLLIQNSGVDIIQYPGKLSAIGMRGFSPSTSNKYNVLLINGIPAGTNNISTIDPSLVQQVEIMKGPFSSLYGSSAMAGVINIVTPRTKGKLTGGANLSYGSFNTIKGNVHMGGTIIKGLNFDLTVYGENQGNNYTIGNNNLLNLNDQEKAIISDTTYGATFDHTKYNQVGGSLRLGYDFNDNWSLDINTGLYSARDIQSHGSFFNVYGSDKKDITRVNTSLELLGKVGVNNIRFTPYYHTDLSEYYNDLSDTTFISSNGTFKNYGFQLQDRLELGNHNIILGIDNSTKRNESKNWVNKNTPGVSYRPDYQLTSYAFIAQAHLKFFEEKLNVSVGGRADLINFELDNSDDHGTDGDGSESHFVFNPNIGLKYEIFKGIHAHASFGTAFFSPDAFQKAGKYTTSYGSNYVGNPDLDPESSTTFDFGAGFNNRDYGVGLDLTYFQTSHKDMIVTVTMDDGITRTYENANEANMNGLELQASYDLGALYDYEFSLKAYANFTFIFNKKMKMDDSDVESNLKYVRNQTGNFGLIFTNQKFSAKFNGRYIGSRIEDNWYTWYSVRPDLVDPQTGSEPSVLNHPRQLIFDASLYYNINHMFGLGLSAGNLFDENYTEKDGYNMPGRNYMLKVIVNF